MNINELREKSKADLLELRSELITERSAIAQKTKEEKRALEAEEVARLEEVRSTLALIDVELEQRAEEERKKTSNVKVTEVEKPVSLTQVLRGIATGSIDDATNAVFERGNEQMKKAGVQRSSDAFNIPFEQRNLLAAKGEPGTAIIKDERQGLIRPLREDSIFSRLGVNVSTGLTGNIEFPIGGTAEAKWKGENEKADAATLAFTSKKFTPKRLTTKIEVSELLLIQDSIGIESYIREQIMGAITDKLESTFFGEGAGSDNEPKGLMNGTTAIKGDASHEMLIKMIAELDKKKALRGNVKFATNPQGFSTLASVPVHDPQTLGFLTSYGNEYLAGYKVERTSGMVDKTGQSPLILANWADMFLGQWGGMSIIKDSITRSDEGVIRFIINTFWDGGFIRDESLVKALFKMPTAGGAAA